MYTGVLCESIYSLPENLIELVRSFHEGMLTTVTVGGEVVTFYSD